MEADHFLLSKYFLNLNKTRFKDCGKSVTSGIAFMPVELKSHTKL
mgnify:CR=1 FL=1